MDEQERLRREALNRVLESEDDVRLICAGPGTGKTTAFLQAFSRVGHRGLALTFIRALTAEMRAALPDGVAVRTFHGHCLYLMRTLFGSEPVLFAELNELLADDIRRSRARGVSPRQIDRAFHSLDDSDSLISDAVTRSSYYAAVSMSGAVRLLVSRLEESPNQIPDYPLVVVDEYQDLSRLEIGLVDLLARTSRVLIAGDDDQALYDFKPATAAELQALAQAVTAYPLPYCSRSPLVVVEAIKDVTREAASRGLLQGRINKPFECFVSTSTKSKAEDSARYPTLVHARITDQNRDSDLMGRYLVKEIRRIDPIDVAESLNPTSPYLTALVVGPEPFLQWASRALATAFPQTQVRPAPAKIDPALGYWMIARDKDSRLGWRILLRCFYSFEADDALTEVIKSGAEVVSCLPDEYRTTHQAVAEVVAKSMREETLRSDELEVLRLRLGRTPAEIRTALRRNPENSTLLDDIEGGASGEPDAQQPTVACKTIVGSKGLSAGHVFVVGFMNRYMPLNPRDVQDLEVRELIVALSRTRKQCHLVSCDVFVRERFEVSEFMNWIRQPVESRVVDEAFLTDA